MSSVTDYGTVLAPTDSALAGRAVAWWDASDTACFGGSFPANDAAVTVWTDKIGSFVFNRTSTGTTYKTSLRGRRAINVSGGGIMEATNFFGDGTGWGDYAIYGLVWHASKDYSSSSNAANAIRSGPTASVTISINSNPASGEIALNSAAWGNGGAWSALGLAKNIGSTITVGGVGGRLNRAFVDGSMGQTEGGFGTLTGSTPNLNLISVFGSGVWAASDIVVVKGSLSWVEAHQLGRWMMQRASIPRKPNTLVTLGNSLTENYGFGNSLRAKFFDKSDDAQCEILNLAKSGGTKVTLADGAGDLAAVLADVEAQGRRAAITLYHGANDGGWPSDVQTQYQTFLAAARVAGHRTVAIGLTPAFAQGSNTALAASDTYIAGCVPTDHDAAFRPYQTAYGAQYNNTAGGGINYEQAWVDGIHWNAVGYNLMVADLGPIVIGQVRASNASRATCAGGAGLLTITRNASDPQLAPLSVRVVSAGSAAPTNAATPIGTISRSQAAGTVPATAGTWDVYLTQQGSPPVKVGASVVVTSIAASYTAAGNVRSGTDRGDGTIGTLAVPSLANTKIGIAGDGGTGTYDGSDRYSDPGVANVLAPTDYKFNSATNNRTGTLTGGSSPTDVAAAVWAYVIDGREAAAAIRTIQAATAGEAPPVSPGVVNHMRADKVTVDFTSTSGPSGRFIEINEG